MQTVGKNTVNVVNSGTLTVEQGKTYFIGSAIGTTVCVVTVGDTSTNVTLIVEDGITVKIAGNTTGGPVVTMAIGSEKSDGDFQYDKNTLVRYSVGSSGTAEENTTFQAVAAGTSTTGYWNYTAGTSLGSFETAIVVTAALDESHETQTVKAYGLNAKGVVATLYKTSATADNVVIVAPAKTVFTTDLTIIDGTGTAKSQVEVTATGTTTSAATDLSISLGSDTLSISGQNNRTYAGLIEVVAGTLTEASYASNVNGLKTLVKGVDIRSTGYIHVWYPFGKDVTIQDEKSVVLAQGFEASKKVTIKDSAGEVISIPQGLKINELTSSGGIVTLAYASSAPTITVTGDTGTVTAGHDTLANWTDAITFSEDVVLGAGRMGGITMSSGFTVTTGTNTQIWGTVTLKGTDSDVGTMSIAQDMTVAGSGAIVQNGQLVTITDTKALIIANGTKFSATINLGSGTAAADQLILTGVKGSGSAGAVITYHANAGDSGKHTIALTEAYSEGTIAAGANMTNVAASGTIYGLTATGAALNASTATDETSFTAANLTANGPVSVASIAGTNTGSIVFAGATVSVTGSVTIASEKTMVISSNTMMSVGSDSAVTATGKLFVLGQLTGGKITGDATKVFTASGSATGYINSKTADGSSAYTNVGEASVAVANFAGLKEAIDLGFLLITATGNDPMGDIVTPGDVKVGADFEIPAGVRVTLDTDKNLTVDAGKSLTVGGELTLQGKGKLSLTTTTSGTQTLLTNSGTIKASNGISVPAGTMFINSRTVEINSYTSTDKADSQIVGAFENSGTLKLKGDDSLKMIIGNDSKAETEFENNGTIESGAMTISVKEGATLLNNGKIDSSDSGSVISGDGTFYNGADGTVGIAVNTKYVTGYTSTMTIAQDMTQKITYMSLQTLEIPEGANLKLTNVADTVVRGKFVVNGTLTIYGTLNIQAVAGAKAAELVVNGEIIVADGGKLIIGETGAGNLTIASGASITVQDGGSLTLANGYNTVTGSLTMDEGSTLSIAKAAAPTVYGTADLNGYVKAGETVYLKNAGVVSIDNGSNDYVSSTGSISIAMAADGAVVNVDSFLVAGLNSTLTITDADLHTYADYSKNVYAYIPEANSDVITIGYTEVTETGTSVTPTKVVVDGTLVIKQSASYKNVYASSTATSYSKAQTYSMDVSGAIAGDIKYSSTVETVQDKVTLNIKTAGTQYFDPAATKKVAENTGSIVVSDELSIDEYVYATIKTQDVDKKGVFSVSGKIVNNLSGAQQMVVDRDATLTVTGEVVSSNVIDDSSSRGTINAVYYQTVFGTGKDKVTTHYYTTLDKAIEGVQAEGSTATKQVTIYGTATLKEDITLPAAVKMTFNDRNAFLYVGTSDARATLTAEAEIVASKQIEVAGTLTFTDKTKDKTSDTVSDVMYESEDANGYRTYTNVYTAIEQAGASGEEMTINVTKEPGTSRDQKVELDQNLTIPSNVTLVVGDDAHTAGLLLKDGVTLTVDGTLKTSQDIVAESRFAVNALDVEVSSTVYYKSSAVVVNGQLMIADSVTSVTVGDGAAGTTSLFANAPIYGAFYTIDKWYVFSNIDDALAETKITSEDVKVYGPVIGSDGTVTANDNLKAINVMKKTFTANDAAKTQTATSLTMNSLTLGDGTFIVMNGEFTGSVLVGENSVAFTKISGLTAAESDDNLVLTGTVSVGTGKSLSVSAGTAYLGSTSLFAVSSGTLKVASGATAIVGYSAVSVAKLNVAGTLEVPANKILTVTGQLDVTGSVIVAEATASSTAGSIVFDKSTSSSGTVTYAKAYVGMSSSDIVTGAAASLTGPFTLNAGASIYVASGATIDQDMTNYKKTAFYNGGSLWFTAYANGSDVTMTVDKAPITNAVLLGWAKTEGATEADYGTGANAITIGKASKLYSVVDTNIYTIVILADTGIGDLYLNGNIMQKGTISLSGVAYYSAFWGTVSYGTYEVTCKLANGYSGTAVLKDSTGATVSANKFTTPEATDYKEVDFQLTGIEKSGYVDPVEPEKKDNSLTVTDYLLIVLVILVVVLAVIVALRLMRS